MLPSSIREGRKTMSVRLEHANLCVRDIEEMTRFLRTAFPEFRVRHEGDDPFGARWIHLGTDDTYLALVSSRREPAERWVPYSQKPGTNHLGYEVSDVEGLRMRLLEAGYEESSVPNAHPYRKRVYFRDPEDNDWEFVEYSSDDPALRNDYEIGG
jgi:catechol 2,3-dioxygenase-like lactoylglutathione lyase family enzyme